MRALLATAVEDGLPKVNPAAGVRVIVKDTRPNNPKWLTPDQTKALLEQMPSDWADLTFFLAATGCRISEGLAARWQDIGPDPQGRPSLTIPKSKSAAGERTIPLSPETARRLTRRPAEARFAADAGPIFPSSTGTPLDAHNYRRLVFTPARERAGVPWATPHKLRHGLASLMANKGKSAAQIAAHLGHADGRCPGSPAGGGPVGDHLEFCFRASGIYYAITIHSWSPLTQVVATLKQWVRSALGK